MDDESYCGTPAMPPAPAAGTETVAELPYAECVLCRKPTEYPESTKGITLCPVCEWQEAQRTACSG
ncbi:MULTISPECIES: hypothetical protein [unclassified Streptomyces]|uniref:hypothetical protein n=1 Tax=unclassified Streptomyces TaxID=2593676 RepID=UPI0036F16180